MSLLQPTIEYRLFIPFCTAVTLALALAFPHEGLSQTDTRRATSIYPGWKELKQRSPDQSDSIDWLLDRSVQRAEEFRNQWNKPDDLEPKSFSLARLTVAFQKEFNSLKPRNPLAFNVGEKSIREAFEGIDQSIDGQTVFGPFQGKWHGSWTDFNVDHHWSQVTKLQPPRRRLVGNQSIDMTAYQYAWVGDGYGFNLTCRKRDKEMTSSYVLGYVEHIRNNDFDEVVARRPHVGLYCGPGKLIWFTSGEVFFEQAYFENEVATAYSIIGFDYAVNTDSFSLKRVFETRYTRSPEDRPPFRESQIQLTVERKPATAR